MFTVPSYSHIRVGEPPAALRYTCAAAAVRSLKTAWTLQVDLRPSSSVAVADDSRLSMFQGLLDELKNRDRPETWLHSVCIAMQPRSALRLAMKVSDISHGAGVEVTNRYLTINGVISEGHSAV